MRLSGCCRRTRKVSYNYYAVVSNVMCAAVELSGYTTRVSDMFRVFEDCLAERCGIRC